MIQSLFKTLTIFCIIFFQINSFSQILEHNTFNKLSKGVLTIQKSVLIQINNAGQRYLGDLKLYHNDDDDFKVIEAKVLDMNGDVLYKAKKKRMLTRSSISRSVFHHDNLITEVKLYGSTYPYQIRYSYEIKTKNFIHLAYWRPRVYKKFTPIKSILEIEIPKDLVIKYKNTPHFKFSESITPNGKKKFRWQLDKLKIPSQESYAPKDTETMPHIIVSPKEFYYGIKGGLSEWKDLGDWYLELNEGNTNLTEDEKNKVDQLINGIENKKEITNKLYHYLQDHTRYVNVSIDLGGFKSYPASYVCKNKYGDCKALTTYMKGLLSYAGVPSNYALIKSGNNSSTDGWIDETIIASQFNHIILAVPLESDTIWLENTATKLPFNYVNTSLQNRKSLWISKGKSQLIQMPKITTDEVFNTTDYNLKFNTKGNASVNIHLNKKGQLYEYLSYFNKTNNNKILQKKLTKNINLKNFNLKDLDIIHQHRDSTSIDIKMTGNVSNQITSIENLKIIIPPKIKIPYFKTPKKRKRNVKINIPINEKITTQYDLSCFNKINIKSRQSVIETEYGIYKYVVTVEHQKIKTYETFILKPNQYQLSEYPEFYQFIKNIKAQQKKLDLLFTTN